VASTEPIEAHAAAASDSWLNLRGEGDNGKGKDSTANAIHIMVDERSARAAGIETRAETMLTHIPCCCCACRAFGGVSN
jgi:hypothetical protein